MFFSSLSCSLYSNNHSSSGWKIPCVSVFVLGLPTTELFIYCSEVIQQCFYYFQAFKIMIQFFSFSIVKILSRHISFSLVRHRLTCFSVTVTVFGFTSAIINQNYGMNHTLTLCSLISYFVNTKIMQVLVNAFICISHHSNKYVK
jgi:hypothetical protein